MNSMGAASLAVQELRGGTGGANYSRGQACHFRGLSQTPRAGYCPVQRVLLCLGGLGMGKGGSWYGHFPSVIEHVFYTTLMFVSLPL